MADLMYLTDAPLMYPITRNLFEYAESLIEDTEAKRQEILDAGNDTASEELATIGDLFMEMEGEIGYTPDEIDAMIETGDFDDDTLRCEISVNVTDSYESDDYFVAIVRIDDDGVIYYDIA